MSDVLVECVPNFSEGVDARRVEAIIAAMRVEGVRLLDWAMDPDHNRSVVTIVGEPAAVVEAAVKAAGKAAELIDLTRQQGEHPRIGAVDVIPFVPVKGIKLEQCALLARQAGLEIWRRYAIPVYFYEAAAARPDRANLEDLRKGQFEGLREAVGKEAARRPDLGALAERHKMAPVDGEVVGLIPEAACERESEWMRHLRGFDPELKILERRLEKPLPWPGEA